MELLACFKSDWIKKMEFAKLSCLFILSANVEYTPQDTVTSHRTALTPDTMKIRKRNLTFSFKSLKFSTKFSTKLCNLVEKLRYKVKFSIYYFLKGQKKALALKRLNGLYIFQYNTINTTRCVF